MRQEVLEVQVALSHLSMALVLLDDLGADLSAAHVDAAIHAFREEALSLQSFGGFLADETLDFSRFDAMIDQLRCSSGAYQARNDRVELTSA